MSRSLLSEPTLSDPATEPLEPELARAPAPPGTFEPLGSYTGLGGADARIVGPGPVPGSERYYISFLYLKDTLEIVALNPDDGSAQVFANPVAGEFGAKAAVLGPDGKIYFGTLPKAHLLRLDPQAGTLTDMGRPWIRKPNGEAEESEQEYILSLAVASDGKIYGGTYPGAKLVRFDPATGAFDELPRPFDETEKYASYVAAGPDGYVYAGIGMVKSNIAAWEIATEQWTSILPEEYRKEGAAAQVYLGTQNGQFKVFGIARTDKLNSFRLENGTATYLDKGAWPAVPTHRLQDGRSVKLVGRILEVTTPGQPVTEHPVGYQGRQVPFFRIGLSPDGKLYGSTVLPIHFVRWPGTKGPLDELGDLGGGEIFSMLAKDNVLVLAAYSGLAPLMAFDPARPFKLTGTETERNPRPFDMKTCKDSERVSPGWRPEALVDGPDGRLYLGALAGYGSTGGPLVAWNLGAPCVERNENVLGDESSVVSLTVWRNFLVGGTTARSGAGGEPTGTEAKVFLWDPAARKVEWSMAPFETAPQFAITGLITAPSGLVYGVAGQRVFVLDPETREVQEVTRANPDVPLTFHAELYNSLALGPDGRIWGLVSEGVIAIDPKTRKVSLIGKLGGKARITAGFALKGRAVYFATHATLWRYHLPSQKSPPGRDS